MKYYGICKRCGYITPLGSDKPNEELEYKGSPVRCKYCKYQLVSMDREANEYAQIYKERTGQLLGFGPARHDFMEKVYREEHPDVVKIVSVPFYREKRIRLEKEEFERQEEKERQWQREREIKQLLSIPRCPKCHSESIVTKRNAFSLNPNSFINVCQNCGKKWKPRG